MSKGRRKKKNNFYTVVLIVGLGLLLGISLWLWKGESKQELASSEEASQEEVEPTPSPSPTPKLKIVDPDSKSRPIAVMIDTNVGNNNHVGLLDAYLQYEAVVEGGLTRIMAIFKDQDTSLIGPIRSSRHYFLDYALENDAIYAHYGWSPYAKTDIAALKVNNINGMTNGGSAYWRDKTIASPHNVFTSIEKLTTRAKELKYDLTTDQGLVFDYSVDAIDLDTMEDAVEADSVLVRYSPTQTRGYTYDSKNQVYLREMNGSAHIDKQSKKQLSYKNVIIMQIENITLDTKEHQDLKNIKSGNGYFLTNGYSVPIKWSKSSRSSKTKYTYLDGSEIVLNDGRTFVQIVPTTYKVSIE